MRVTWFNFSSRSTFLAVTSRFLVILRTIYHL
nr:MAG TPA: hypothetical protein [Caudoviricetes sp.]